MSVNNNNSISTFFGKQRGFTLAETLITLVIIGIIAAIVIPLAISHYQWKQYRAGALKALSYINQIANLYQPLEGTNPLCGYWEKNPYSAAGNGAVCQGYSDEGFCTGWKLKDGSSLPPDYNGFFDDCKKLYDFFEKNMKTVKVCPTDAYANGCIPKYEGIDTIYKSKNSDKSDYDVARATGSSGFRQSAILSGSAFITTDGIIYFSYIRTARFIAFDINGFKGPNKWGYDVFAIIPYKKSKFSPPKYYNQYAAGSLTEKGGKTLKELIQQKE